MDATTLPGVSAYTDALGRTQWAVTGPGGHLLVTRNSRLDRDWQVWWPDSLNTLQRLPLDRALRWAHQRVNP